MADVNVTYHLRRNDRVIVRGHIDATCDGFTHQLRACRQICGQKRERDRETWQVARIVERRERSMLFPDACVFLASEDRHVTRLVSLSFSLSRVVPDRPQAGTADEWSYVTKPGRTHTHARYTRHHERLYWPSERSCRFRPSHVK